MAIFAQEEQSQIEILAQPDQVETSLMNLKASVSLNVETVSDFQAKNEMMVIKISLSLVALNLVL